MRTERDDALAAENRLKEVAEEAHTIAEGVMESKAKVRCALMSHSRRQEIEGEAGDLNTQGHFPWDNWIASKATLRESRIFMPRSKSVPHSDEVHDFDNRSC